MADTALLFFAGLAGVVALSRIVSFLYDPQNVWALSPSKKFIVVLVISFVALVAVFVFPTLPIWPWPPTPGYWKWPFFGWVLLHTIALGCWIAFLAGCAAGFVLAAALNAMSQLKFIDNKINVLLFAAGPAITILVLYLLAMPGVTQRLGLTGVKAGEFEITLAPSRTVEIPRDVSSLNLPNAQAVLGNLADKYTPWFQNIWPMFQPPKDPAKTDFIDLTWFQRQALYLKYDPKKAMEVRRQRYVDIPLKPTPDQADKLTGIAKTIWDQEQFIGGLKPVVGCAAFYHLHFPQVDSVKPFIQPMLETALSIEIELEEIASGRTNQQVYRWIRDNTITLQEQAAESVIHFHDLIPPAYRNTNENNKEAEAPKWSDCEPDQLKQWLKDDRQWFKGDQKLPTPLLKHPPLITEANSITVQPPYLTIIIANIYGALGEKDAGLRVLNSWLKSYSSFKNKENEYDTTALYDEAVWQYGLVQEADETLPTTSAERDYLKMMKNKLATDWNINLYNAGCECGDVKTQADLDNFRKMEITADPDTTFSAGLETRLVLLYSNLTQRLLYSTLQTLPSLDQDYLTPENEDWARQLIFSSHRCLLDESQKWQDYRQALDGLLGGVTLARWAEDGVRSGLVLASTAPDVEKDALKALLAALPTIRDTERTESKMDEFRSTPTEWETYRLIVNRTVLDLQAKLAR